MVPKTVNGSQAIDDQRRSNRNCGTWAKVEADARFDGLFVLRTNTKIAALQVVLRYRNLLAVEDAFKTAKALLATRPIFHKTDAGIRGHVFCTFLALAQVPQFRFERR